MAFTEQYTLRWNNFHNNLTSSLYGLLQEEHLVDVTLAAEGKYLQAHKLLLSLCSPYFKSLFQINPCKHPIVILNVGFKHLKDILTFMYQGEVHVQQDELSSFLKTAELLQVKGLTDSTDSSETNEECQTDSRLSNEQSVDSIISSPVVKVKAEKRASKSSSVNQKKTKIEVQNDDITLCIDEDRVMDDRDSKQEQYGSLEPEYYDVQEEQDFDEMMQDVKAIPPEIKMFVDNGNLPQSEETSKTIFKCPQCYKSFANRYNMKVHVRDKHSPYQNMLDCSICGRTMRNQSCLRVHLYNHRKLDEQKLQSDQTPI